MAGSAHGGGAADGGHVEVTPSDATPDVSPEVPPAAAPVIAIDGPAAAGKGTLARRLAEALGFAHMDTGLLYRAVGRRVLDEGGDPADPDTAERAARSLLASDLGRTDLRSPEADVASSKVAAHPGVRTALLDFQRQFGRAACSGAVLDGRDIGTVVFPDATVKLFVTASDEERARRRWLEQNAQDPSATLDVVRARMKARDARDAGRSTAPTRPASDAVILDTTGLTLDAAFERAVALVRERLQKAWIRP